MSKPHTSSRGASVQDSSTEPPEPEIESSEPELSSEVPREDRPEVERELVGDAGVVALAQTKQSSNSTPIALQPWHLRGSLSW